MQFVSTSYDLSGESKILNVLQLKAISRKVLSKLFISAITGIEKNRRERSKRFI